MEERYIIRQEASNLFQFNLETEEEEILLNGNDYKTLALCKKAIAQLKTHAFDDELFVRNNDDIEGPSFKIISTTGKILATSKTYSSFTLMEQEIEILKPVIATSQTIIYKQ
ncbi:DUF1508 domain-containing protein [Zhouia sp. PK063]|uniref:DUF1508 domain-containing protein n=1 Tax=Zhouia sp. PK063 TaxID=3373602 RepID=UPI003787D233